MYNNLKKRYFSFNFSKLIFFILIFSPYITFGIIQSDNSPFYLFICILLNILFFLYNREQRIYSIALVTIAATGLIVAAEIISMDIQIEVLKFIASYYLILVLIQISKILKINNPDKIVFIIAIIWVVVTVVSFIKPGIFSFLFFRSSTDNQRGATGLSTEPANWGQASAFMIILADRLIDSRKRRAFAFSAYSISCLLSLSAFGLIYLSFVCWHVFGFRRVLIAGVSGLLSIYFLLPESFRLSFLIKILLSSSGLIYFFTQDNSIARRLISFTTSIKILTHNELILGQYFSRLSFADARLLDGFTLSGINILTFRYGIFGVSLCLLFIYGIVFLLRKAMNDNMIKRRLPLWFCLFFMVFVGPIAFPYFYLAIAISKLPMNTCKSTENFS